MGCQVHTNRHGTLTLRLYWRGRTWESTGLKNTRENCRTAAAIADLINAEIKMKKFTRERYLHYFPRGSRADRYRTELGLVAQHAGSLTLREYADTQWLPRQKPPLVRKSYARDVRGHLRRYVVDVRLEHSLFGDLPIGQVTPAHLEALRSHWLEKGISLKTVKNAMNGTLRAMLRAARREGLVAVNPCDEMEWPRQKPTPPNPMERDEMHAVLAHFRAERPAYYPFIAMLLLAGMRPSEAAALRWRYVDLQTGRVQILASRVLWEEGPTKTDASERTIRIMPALIAVLREIRPVDAKPDQYVFVGPRGIALHQDRVRERQWVPALKEIKVSKRRLYDCRHTFISQALTEGVNLKYLAEYCGTSVQMVEKRYGRFLHASEAEELARIGRLAGGESGDPTREVTTLPPKKPAKSRVSEGS